MERNKNKEQRTEKCETPLSTLTCKSSNRMRRERKNTEKIVEEINVEKFSIFMKIIDHRVNKLKNLQVE